GPSSLVFWDGSWPGPAGGGQCVCLVWSSGAGQVQQALDGSDAGDVAHRLLDFEHGIRVVQLPTNNHRRALDLEVQAAVRNRPVSDAVAVDTVEKRGAGGHLRPLAGDEEASPGQ